eukprot:GHUV01054070.1.p1 GENE.GHUV01054070.1~~GHUV01054070.1.p1  ORF type:complete len:132 (+),score=0.83 GHUV01054070.1:437-832(+)
MELYLPLAHIAHEDPRWTDEPAESNLNPRRFSPERFLALKGQKRGWQVGSTQCSFSQAHAHTSTKSCLPLQHRCAIYLVYPIVLCGVLDCLLVTGKWDSYNLVCLPTHRGALRGCVCGNPQVDPAVKRAWH